MAENQDFGPLLRCFPKPNHKYLREWRGVCRVWCVLLPSTPGAMRGSMRWNRTW